MKRCLVLALGISLCMAVAVRGQEERRGEARTIEGGQTAGFGLVRLSGTLAMPLVEAPPKIDGKLDDEAWKRAQPMSLWSHGGKPATYETTGYICRDGENFYFAAVCADDDMANLAKESKSPVLWKNDCVELFIVPDRERAYYAHIMLSCDGQYFARTMTKDSWDEPTVVYPLPQMDVKVTEGPRSWTIEASIPIKAFGRNVTPESVWAVGFNREKHSSPSEVSEFCGGFNTPDKYPPTYFDARALVTDGVGVRNISGKPAEAEVTLAFGDRTDKQKLTIAPLETKMFDWQKLVGTPEAGQEFTVTIAQDGKTMATESYVVAPARAKLAVVPASEVPPLAMREDSPLRDPNFFPIGVWLQAAGQARKYSEAGVNTFIAMNGWSEATSATFKELGLYAILTYNARFKNDPRVIAWMHGDEPDNSSPDSSKTWTDYRAWRLEDSTRPVFVNLGQGVANERFGVLTPDNYRGYCRAADILCFDVYPVTNIGAGPDGHNRLCIVAKGVTRLRQWSDNKKPVWIILECTRIHNREEKPSPAEVRTEAWMSIVHGATGIAYFCHDFTLKANGSIGLLLDPEMLAAVTKLNHEIQALAPVLNSPTVAEGVSSTSSKDSRVDVMVKKHGGATYIFAVNMFNRPETPTITVAGLPDGKAEVLGEDRQADVAGGKIVEDFAPYAVRIYRVGGE